MKRGRPYPPDRERRVRIKTELAKRDMSISDLAKALRISIPLVSYVINGIRRSKKTEERIAFFFGKPREELFPSLSMYAIEAMRRGAA